MCLHRTFGKQKSTDKQKKKEKSDTFSQLYVCAHGGRFPPFICHQAGTSLSGALQPALTVTIPVTGAGSHLPSDGILAVAIGCGSILQFSSLLMGVPAVTHSLLWQMIPCLHTTSVCNYTALEQRIVIGPYHTRGLFHPPTSPMKLELQ